MCLLLVLCLCLCLYLFLFVSIWRVGSCCSSRIICLILTGLTWTNDLVIGQGFEHSAEHLDVSRRKLLEKLIKACLNDIARDHVQLEELCNEFHVAMHLILLANLELILIENEEHLPVEVLAQIVFKECFLHGGTALAPVHLLSLKHLVELLLAPIQQKLLKVHFGVLRVVKLLEKTHT